MNKLDKKTVTRQQTINNYKSPNKSYAATASQNFGLIPETFFSKPQFNPKIIQWITPYNLYAACDDKFFYIFDRSGKIKNSAVLFDAFHISSCLTFTYIERFHCFAIISSDLKLLIVSVLLDLWKTLSLSGRVNHIDFFTTYLFLGGTSKLQILSIQCDSKYDIEKSLLLDPDRGFVNFKLEPFKEITLNLKWIKGMKVFKQYETMLIWSECNIIVLSLNNFVIRAEGEDLCPGTLITDVSFASIQEYLIAGTTQGSVYIYKIGSNFKVVHVFQSHTRSISSVVVFNQSLYCVTASMDYTVKVWSLEHYRILYTFELPSTESALNFLTFLDYRTLAYNSNSSLTICNLNLIGTLSFITVSSVKSLKMIDDKISAIGEDNSIVLYESGKVTTTIYPPPSAHDLKEVHFLEQPRKVLILLDSGIICIFSINSETGLLERMIRTGDITDSESRPVLSPIQCIQQVKCVPPQYDCELVFRKHNNPESPHSKFLAMSAGKGTLIFMTVDKIDKIYARFSMHRETIVTIEEIQNYIITMCAANIVIISAFHDNILVKVKRLELRSQILYLRGLDPDKIFFSFNTGQTEIVQMYEEKLIRLINKEAESDTLITSLDIIQENQIIVTASSNNTIHIWTFDKQLLHEIKFPNQISSVLMDNESIFISYKQITTTIKVRKYFEPGTIETEEISEDYFKNMQNYNHSESEHSPAPIEVEKTPDLVHLSSRLLETRVKKYTADLSLRKKKPATKKNKKKRTKNAKSAVKSRPAVDAFDEDEIKYMKVISKKIPVLSNARPISHNTLLTRRQLTEEKIIENIRRYGDPADRIDYSGLCVVDESLYYEELAKLRGSNSII